MSVGGWCLRASSLGSSVCSWVGSSGGAALGRAFPLVVGGFAGLAAADIYTGEGVAR
jgi:hypothetical protein